MQSPKNQFSSFLYTKILGQVNLWVYILKVIIDKIEKA